MLVFSQRGENRASVLAVFENTHISFVTCTSNVTSLGWGGVGMLTFMLTCVTCTSNVTSLGWGGGDVNVHVNLRHMYI